MIDHLKRSEMFRKQLKEQERISTDPAWVRAQTDEHQFSPAFIIVTACVGALAMYGIFSAIASI